LAAGSADPRRAPHLIAVGLSASPVSSIDQTNKTAARASIEAGGALWKRRGAATIRDRPDPS